MHSYHWMSSHSTLLCTRQQGLTPFFVNSARHPRVPTLLAVGRPTAPRGSTLRGDEGDKHRLSAAHGILSAKEVTRSNAESAVLTPRGVASLLDQWTKQTLFDPLMSTRPPTANIESARPIDDMVV